MGGIVRLKNKRTGEIIEFDAILTVKDVAGDSVAHLEYNSLTKLNEEWEDYEEPKECYCIDWTEPDGIHKTKHEDIRDDFNKEIGNYFSSREEAEKAVEKLKAWKRLKDKGFRLLGYYHMLVETISKGEIGFEMDDYKGTKQDLDLLFGGEE